MILLLVPILQIMVFRRGKWERVRKKRVSAIEVGGGAGKWIGTKMGHLW